VKPKLLIILASTRPGRVGLPVAEWFAQFAATDDRFDVELVDLAKLALPLLDEPNHPRLRDYTQGHTIAWSETVDAADAIVFVTAEYNHGYPAALKNAIDYLHHEWRLKPLGFVSYGGVAAGTRSVQQLKQVAGSVQLMPAGTAVHIPFVATVVDDGRVTPNDQIEQAASAMLGELEVLHGALAPLRAAG
jgi:NAD(P)H-dependent FMN reductase